MQQPAVAAADRDAGVAERVARQRDQQDLGVRCPAGSAPREAQPLLAAGLVLDPARTVGPVRGDVARCARASPGFSAAAARAPSRWTSASGKSGRPPEWSRSRWVVTMWRTSPGWKPSALQLGVRGLAGEQLRADERVEEAAELAPVARRRRGRSRCRRARAPRRPRSAGSGRPARVARAGRPRPCKQARAARAHRAAVEVVDRARGDVHRRESLPGAPARLASAAMEGSAEIGVRCGERVRDLPRAVRRGAAGEQRARRAGRRRGRPGGAAAAQLDRVPARPRSRRCRSARAPCRSTGTGAARRSRTCSPTAARRC